LRLRAEPLFPRRAFEHKAITKHEHYTQREWIADLFGYRPWAAEFLARTAQQAAQSCGAT
jgi:hypothetical protein